MILFCIKSRPITVMICTSSPKKIFTHPFSNSSKVWSLNSSDSLVSMEKEYALSVNSILKHGPWIDHRMEWKRYLRIPYYKSDYINLATMIIRGDSTRNGDPS